MNRFEDLQPRSAREFARARLAAALAVAFLAAVPAAAQPRAGGLFSQAEPSASGGAAVALRDDITIRRREVTIDFDMLALSRVAAGDPAEKPVKLTLNLFDDTVLTAIVDHTAPTSSGYSLSGTIEGVEYGTMTLVVNGPVIAGSVRTPTGAFLVESVGGRLYAISEVDESKLPPIHEPNR